MNSRAVASPPKLLELSTRNLLAEFGAGNPVPGSGSASALNGALACSLLATSAKLTIARAKQQVRRTEAEYILQRINEKAPILQSLVQEDSDIFSKVIDARHARERARTERSKRQYSSLGRNLLQQCSEVAIRIVTTCLEIAKLGLALLRIGYHAAKGDPAAGTSNALAGAFGAICVVLVNLKTTRGGEWAVKTYDLISKFRSEHETLQDELMRAITGLCRPEDLLTENQPILL
jgi:methenyltetrahydrofolate cyclohydrolase